MNKNEVAKLLAMVVNVYPNIKLADGTVDAWHFLLEDLPFDLAKPALKAVLQQQLYPTLPTIGAIRQAVVDLRDGKAVPAAVAWQMTCDWAAGKGKIKDSCVEEAAHLFGSWTINNSSNPAATRAQFIKAYEELIARRNNEAIVSPDLKPGRGLKLIEGVKDA